MAELSDDFAKAYHEMGFDPQFPLRLPLPGAGSSADIAPATGIAAELEFQTSLDNKRTKNRLAQRKHRSELRQRQQNGQQAHNAESSQAQDTLPPGKSQTTNEGENSFTNHGHGHGATWQQNASITSQGEVDPNHAEFPFQLPEGIPEMAGTAPAYSDTTSEYAEFTSPEEFLFSPSLASPNLTHATRHRSVSGSVPGNLVGLGDMDMEMETEASCKRLRFSFSHLHPHHVAHHDASAASCLARKNDLEQESSRDESIEGRMIRVLNAVEETGFASFDAVVTAYYTTTFAEGSLPHYAQSTSRSKRLRQFLTDLHENSKTWVGREAQGYHDERIAAMEKRYEEEMARLVQSDTRGSESDVRKRAFIADTVAQLLQDETTSSLFRRDKQFLREQLPETWSLLSKIARHNTAEVDISRAICVFLYILRVLK